MVKSTTWNCVTSLVLTGRSNNQERCDQAVVHAQGSAMDYNSIIALFLSYHRYKRRRNRLHWVHPEIKRGGVGAGKNSVPFTLHLVNYEIAQTGILIIFECLFHLLKRSITVRRTVFSIITVK
jgi:hypothetical protein